MKKKQSVEKRGKINRTNCFICGYLFVLKVKMKNAKKRSYSPKKIAIFHYYHYYSSIFFVHIVCMPHNAAWTGRN